MIGVFGDIGRRGLFMFDPETAHGMSIAAPLKTPDCLASCQSVSGTIL